MSIVVSQEIRRTAPPYSPVFEETPAELLSVGLVRCQPAKAVVLESQGGLELKLNLLCRDEVYQRYSSKYQMNLAVADLTDEVVAIEPVEFVHAAQVLEQTAQVTRCVDNLISLVAAKGTLSIVLQMHTDSRGMVSPVWLAELLAERCFRLVHQRELTMGPRRGYWLGLFSRG